jgi:hypothetical protein
MDRSTQITDRPGRLADLNAMLFSAVVHFAALITLGLLTAAAQENWRGVRLLVNVGDGTESATIDDSPLQDAVELEVAADPAAAMGPVQLFADVALPTSDFAALDALSETAAEVSGFEGLALGGNHEADGTTDLASTEFFGIGGYGQSFVYVVDSSDSMNERGKFDRARYELLQSIEQLGSDQRYFVIFFNDGAHPMEADELVLATKDQVARTARWVSYVEADGGTNPLPALLFALSLRPDAVYFLSDGQFDPVTITQLRVRNRPNRRLGTREIPIHAIAFVDRATERLMRTIAKNSGGEYRFVK